MNENVVSYICDKLCRYPYEIEDQNELNDICEKCPLATGDIPENVMVDNGQA